jgi:MoaA/NifB/PqqE/SkfB family radical SAM enzyme
MSSKAIITIRIKITVAKHYFKEWMSARLSAGEYYRLMKRLNYFIGKMQGNKYASLDGKTKIDLYIPAFPSKAFFTACDKFKVSDEVFPCSTVLISVTKACRFSCKHCYQRLDKGSDVEIDRLVEVVKEIQDNGVAFFNIEGGDPFLTYARLLRVCQSIDDRSTIWINSTGDGITVERLKELKHNQVRAIMFSLHFVEPEALNEFMGRSDAWQTMINGIRLCKKAGMPFAFNSCLSKDDFFNGQFEKIMEFAKNQGASLIQLIKPKSAGAWLNEKLPHADQNTLELIKQKVNTYNLSKDYASFPSVSAQIIEEDAMHFGCTAGGTDRFYINAKGDLQPCEFLNISYGNISESSFGEIYQKMRTDFNPPGECWLCEENASKVAALYKENNLQSLPLTPELSDKIIKGWDRGKETALYKEIKKK